MLINLSYRTCRYNNSQAKVIVDRTLSPISGTDVYSIPVGSIIYHSKGVTTVFDSTGKQILSAEDAKSTMVYTPQGSKSATYVHKIPGGSFINTQNNRTYTIYNNQIILTEITQDSSVVTSMSTPSDWPARYVEGIEYNPSQSLGEFTSQWTVPAAPALTVNSEDIAIWNGVDSTSGTEAVIQPVLTWNQNNDGSYTIAAWQVINGVSYEASQFGANVGDTIIGTITWEPSLSYRLAEIEDVNTGSTSPLYSNIVSPTSAQVTQILEAFGSDSGNQYLPAPITFTNNALYSTGGGYITPTAQYINAYLRTFWSKKDPLPCRERK